MVKIICAKKQEERDNGDNTDDDGYGKTIIIAKNNANATMAKVQVNDDGHAQKTGCKTKQQGHNRQSTMHRENKLGL